MFTLKIDFSSVSIYNNDLAACRASKHLNAGGELEQRFDNDAVRASERLFWLLLFSACVWPVAKTQAAAAVTMAAALAFHAAAAARAINNEYETV